VRAALRGLPFLQRLGMQAEMHLGGDVAGIVAPIGLEVDLAFYAFIGRMLFQRLPFLQHAKAV